MGGSTWRGPQKAPLAFIPYMPLIWAPSNLVPSALIPTKIFASTHSLSAFPPGQKLFRLNTELLQTWSKHYVSKRT